MKISSKSILSPGRPRDAPVSLSTSLSRRLKTNGSLKGGQSPMFPTGGKKRGGCAFENPEPSSPKVTCIGQVRVKTKKQGKKIRTLSKRRVGGGGEVSFRRIEQCRDGINPNQTQQEGLTHRNQRWVHLPLTICEALRAFGAEVSCLFPCRSSCFSTASERGKEEKPPAAAAGSDGNGQSSCGAVFARWFVSLQDGDEGGKGRREIELVVGGDEEERTETGREEILRRHMEIEREMKDEKCEAKEGSFDEEEDGARVSICIPPKNALLLMRCRSDPVRMSALAHRFWESPAHKVEKDEEEEEDNEEEEEEDEGEGYENVDSESLKGGDTRENEQEEEEEANSEVAVRLAMEVQEAEEKENSEEMLEYLSEELQEEDQEEKEPVADQEVNLVAEAAEENEVTCSFSEAFSDPDNIDNEDDLNSIQEKQEEDEDEEDEEERKATPRSPSVACIALDSEAEEEQVMPKALAEEAALEEEQVVAEEKSKGEKETQERTLKEEETVIVERTESEKPHAEEVIESEERERESHARLERESKVKKKKKERENGSVLPDCLLLMMCEPKLSMEVSKETWVCSTDFIRWLPERAVNAIDAGDDPKKRISTDSNPAKQHRPPQQPPRSSCSFPAPAALSMATMIEQKLVNAVAYEPFVLTRCKSEPMRTAAAKLAPDSCFWKNRKLEPHRRATFGIGAAGVGF
ncbi:hypothetical protein U1Q18_024236 [Sarracenia purpurea var. burkii]